MAEYKNGFNAFGGIPVDSSRRSPELHTGRAVYINDDEYSKEPNYKNKADSIVREGYHKEAPFEAPEIIVPEPIIPSGTKNITENGTYDVAQFAKAEVNVASGSSSDFSTAQVTIVNNTAESLDILLLPTYDVERGTGFTMCTLGNQLDSGASVTIPVVLYKGMCIWVTYAVDVYTDYTFIGSGNVSIMDSGVPIITGDCTITITNGDEHSQ